MSNIEKFDSKTLRPEDLDQLKYINPQRRRRHRRTKSSIGYDLTGVGGGRSKVGGSWKKWDIDRKI